MAHQIDPELDLELVRDTDLAPELIWRAWTTPELVTRWFTPKPYETPVCEIDLRPGGRFRTVIRSPEGDEVDATGCFLEVVPPRRLVWTGALGPGFRPQPGPMAFTAIIELEPTTAGGTRYRAIVLHQSAEDRRQHEEMGWHAGWGASFEQLVECMRTQTEGELPAR